MMSGNKRMLRPFCVFPLWQCQSDRQFIINFRIRIMRARIPAATALSGKSRVTIDPAPITVWFSICTQGVIMTR